MKALSIKQPWIWAILHIGKDIENRDWPTRFRGTIALHASKEMTRDEYQDALYFIQEATGKFQCPDFEEIVRGAILGTVGIVDCVSKSSSPWFVGKYGFVMRNPRILETPIECKGALGFWDVPVEIERLMVSYTIKGERL